MLDRIVPKKIIYFIELIRLNKPIGSMLLLWPCWFALAQISEFQIKILFWYLYFLIGAFLMRSVGCIINDIIDINIDKKVERTAQRALTSNKISINEALVLLTLLLFFSFIILIQFKFYSIIVGLASIPLIILYPYMKRFTYWPQFALGLIFNWGVLIVSVEFYNSINLDLLLLYIACIFWTLAYDTIYACQDKEDDIKNNIKSTAVFFGSKGLNYVRLFYTIFFLILGFVCFKTTGSLISLVVIIVFIFGINIYLNKWKINSRSSSNYYFRFNNVIGLICFLFLLIF